MNYAKRLYIYFILSIFCSTPLTMSGQKYCTDWKWAAQATVVPENSAIDEAGNTFIIGRFYNSVSFGNHSVQTPSSQSQGVFLVKVNNTGGFEWVKCVGSGSSVMVGGVYTDSTGDIIVGFTSQINFDQRIHVAKYNSSGQLRWETSPVGTKVTLSSFTVDDSGYAVVNGFINYQSTKFGSTTLLDGNYLAKLDKDGKWMWAKKTPLQLQDLKADSLGDLYGYRAFNNTLKFGTYTLTATGTDIALVKLSNTGSELWAVKIGGPDNDLEIPGFEVENDGTIYLSGRIEKEITLGTTTYTTSGYALYVAQLHSAGSWQWAKKVESPDIINPSDLATDKEGGIYIYGRFRNTLTFGTSQVTSTYLDIFVAKMDNSGNWVWAANGENNANTSITPVGISVNTDKDIFLSGYTYSPPIMIGGFSITKGCFVLKFSNEPIDANAGNDKNIKCGSSVALDASARNYKTVKWRPSTGLSDPAVLNPTASPIVTTYYTLIAKNACGDSVVTGLTVNVDPITSQAGADKTTINCGESAQLNANLNFSNGVSVSWAPATGLNNVNIAIPVATPLITTTYTVTATTANGCSTSSQVTVNVNPLTVNASASEETIVCGEKTQLSAVPNISGTVLYKWSPSEGLSNSSIANPIANPIANTTYEVTASTPNGCTATSQITIEVEPLKVTASAQKNTINCGETTQLGANVNMSEPVSYLWSPVVGLSDITAVNPTTKPAFTTTYTVIATSSNGCTAEDQVTIQVNNPNPPHVGLTSSTGQKYFCHSGLTLSASAGFASYLWSTGETSQTIVPTYPGTYVVEVMTPDGCGNKDSITLTPPTKIIAKDGFYFCPNQQGSSVQLDAGAGMDSYLWSNGQETRTISVSQAGTYWVTVRKGSCEYTATATVMAHPGYTDAEFVTMPNGLQVTFEPITQGIRFLDWDFGDGKHSGDIVATHTYASEGTYDVCLEMTDFCGFTDKKCRSITVSGQVGIDHNSSLLPAMPEVYPNPATSTVTLKMPAAGNKTIRITDLTGREAMPSMLTAQGQLTIDVSLLAKGIYIISINQVTQKLVIQ